jgi:hypothetical protein
MCVSANWLTTPLRASRARCNGGLTTGARLELAACEADEGPADCRNLTTLPLIATRYLGSSRDNHLSRAVENPNC